MLARLVAESIYLLAWARNPMPTAPATSTATLSFSTSRPRPSAEGAALHHVSLRRVLQSPLRLMATRRSYTHACAAPALYSGAKVSALAAAAVRHA